MRNRPDFSVSAIFALAAPLVCLFVATPARAQDAPLPSVSIGGGMRTSYVHDAPEDEDGIDTFALNSARLYVSGSVTKTTKFMFNTEYEGGTNKIGILDAAAQFSFSPGANIWVGRFLAPSDRANLYGPYYANHWAVYTDGVQDGYPFISQGRSNGAMYWGQFGKVKVAGGGFDGASQTSDDTIVAAGRVQVDFWDAEDGYYQNGTYYGDKNLLALGVAGQAQGSDKGAYTIDFLLERKAGEGGAFTIEAEWAKYDGLGGYSSHYSTDQGGYVLGSYLFPKPVGAGKFQVLAKFAQASFSNGVTIADADYDQTTNELNLNYIIKQFNSRVMMFYKDQRNDDFIPNDKQFGIGLQVQM